MPELADILNRACARIERRGAQDVLVMSAGVLDGRVVLVGGMTAELQPGGRWTQALPALRVVPDDASTYPSTRSTPSPGLQPDLGPLLDCVRARGWRVAAHNDYVLDGERCTAWILEREDDGRRVRADAASDLDALMDAFAKIKAADEEKNR